jgi:phage/plasmid-like protein (TIGR03299 family)
MTAAITITNGQAAFAFNGDNGDPWHHLGTDVRGLGTKEQMLDASLTNWRTEYAPLFIQLPDGSFQAVETHKATTRSIVELTEEGVTATSKQLGIVGSGYVAEHNADAVDYALAIVEATSNDAVIDTMGSLYDDRQFFTCLDLGAIVLDPDGMRDVIKRYLIVRNAHDGGMSLTAFTTNTRVVCSNTADMAQMSATDIYRVRHTTNKEAYKAEAVAALGVAETNRRRFISKAEAMMGAAGGHDLLTKAIEGLWNRPTADATDRVKDNWSERSGAIHKLYEAPTNAGGFGHSGWTVWNTIVEYLDHGRKGTVDQQALAVANGSGDVQRLKTKAAELVLASA